MTVKHTTMVLWELGFGRTEKAMIYQVPEGLFTAHVGGASDKLSLSADFVLTEAPVLPDWIVTKLRKVPAFPIKGEEVHFVATLLNRGTGSTSIGKAPVVSFRVNGKSISSSPELQLMIPARGMSLVCGLIGAPWSAAAGIYSVQAEVDPTGRIEETLETNNLYISVRSVRPKSFSPNKP